MIRKRSILLYLIFSLCAVTVFAEDSIRAKPKSPQFISAIINGGMVLATNDFVKGDKKIPFYTSVALKYGRSANGNDWEDIAYGMPYWGVGLYTASFFRNSDLGNPLSLFAFQGATIKELQPQLAIMYEWNLGMSFLWKPYDPFNNPKNIALGSAVNAHVSGNIYLKWYISKHIDLHWGIGITHFSNGASRLPNSGLNLFSSFVEVVYNFDRKQIIEHYNPSIRPPKLNKRIDYDLTFTITSRQTTVDTLGTGLPSKYLDRKFKVFGLSYAMMFVNSYKYKWGPSIDFVYDESSEIKAWRQLNTVDNKLYDRVSFGKPGERFSAGVSIKGEVLLPHTAIFANLGYNILHGNKRDNRLYQILGIKIYIKDNIYGTFGIRASNFSKAQYLYWSLGYTIEGRCLKKRKTNL